MATITLVTYCHEAHACWVDHWIKEVKKQSLFGDERLKILFIMHNWKDQKLIQSVEDKIHREIHFLNACSNEIDVLAYNSEPVIGEVIDFAVSFVGTDYFAHWDIDDIFYKDRLKMQLEYLEANPDVDFLNARCMGFTGQESDEWPHLLAQETSDEAIVEMLTHPDLTEHKALGQVMMMGYNPFSHGLMVYKPEIITWIGGFSSSDVKKDGLSPDFETWKKAYREGYKFHRLPELLMQWRLDSSSIRK
jgi:hypothetical protein